MRKIYLLLIMITALLLKVSAQDIRISGTVTGTDKLSLPGVTVRLLGTGTGTVTDVDGKYSIQAPANGVLVFSFVGMQTQEITINGKTEINIEMIEEEFDLGEIVVMGYSTNSKKLISGSFELVKENEIKEAPVRTIDAVLQGKTAGVSVFMNSGTPGGQTSIKMRGGSSINASNTPLIVIDGVPAITGSYGQVGMSGQEIDALSDLNPNDIESITVLKDASTTAIYGARASNGVILVTTKKGSTNKTDVNFNTSLGWQVLPPEREISLMNAEQWNEYRSTDIQGIDTDWMSEILQVAPTSNTELSISAGNDMTRMFLSGNYFNQDGIVMGTDYKRYSGRLNVDHQIIKNLTIGGGVSLSYSDNARVEGDQTLHGPLPNAMSIPAIYPVYNPDGTYNEDGPYSNPVAIAKESVNKAYTNRTNGNIYLDYKFLDGFTFTTRWGADIYNLREHSYDPITTRQGKGYNGLGIEGTSYVSNLVTNNVLQYSTLINEKHSIEALAGFSTEKYSMRSTYIEGIDFPNPDLQYIISAGTIRYADATATDRGLVSYFGQLKYNYKFKYILGVTARSDGSSKFGKNNRYGYFPSASIAWRMSEEDFMNDVSFVNELKIRGLYGMTGNDGIPDFQSMGLYYGGYNYGGEAGTAPVQLPNPDLKWETTVQTGIGLDLGLFKDRISLNADYYVNKTRDLLLDRPLPSSTGFTSITANIGEMENKGVEIVLNTVNIDKQVKWTSALTFGANRNKVTSLYENQPIDDFGRGGNRVEVGEPIGIFFGYVCLGVDPTTGNLVYDDLDGDGIITADDRKKIGDPNPDFIGGFTNILSYKSFELSVFLNMVYGNDIFNGTLIYLESGGFEDGAGEDNQTTNMVRRWKQPGDVTDMPRAGDTRKSSRFIEDGSFMRIQNVTLSYNFKKEFLKKIRMKTVRLFVAVQNLYTFTKYTGMDPEVNYYGGTSNVIMGTDFFTYPQPRTYLLGLNLSF
jgi:TonB-dependent starch-binding outer membrane protein SusC